MAKLATVGRKDRRGQAQVQVTEPYLSFRVSGLGLMLPLASVSEISAYERVSDLPGSPSFLRGVVHVRGRVVPVIDIASRLGRPDVEIGRRTCIFMLDVPRDGQLLQVGIVSDGVASLLDVERAQIKAPPEVGGVHLPHLRGVYFHADTTLSVIDFVSLLADIDTSSLRPPA